MAPRMTTASSAGAIDGQRDHVICGIAAWAAPPPTIMQPSGQQKHHDKQSGHRNHLVPPRWGASIAHFRVGTSGSDLQSKGA